MLAREVFYQKFVKLKIRINVMIVLRINDGNNVKHNICYQKFINQNDI